MNDVKTISVPVSLLQNFVGFVEKSGALMEQAGESRKQAKQAAALTVDELVKQGLLDESQRTVAQTSLGDNHVKTLEALRKTAGMAAPASMGKAANDETSALTPTDQANAKFLSDLGF
jgi:hypothetical protein